MCGNISFSNPKGVSAPLNETLSVTCVYMASPPPQGAGEDEGVREKAIEYVHPLYPSP